MNRLSEKLDALGETAALASARDHRPLAASIAAGRGRRVIAVGSGGSVIACAFLARCRETLLGEPTEVVSPMELVVGHGDLETAIVWVFSASADNPDTLAAVIAARSRGAQRIELVTRNPTGAVVAALPLGAVVHEVPVADSKDSFLATHSLVAMLGALLLSADAASTDPVGESLGADWLNAVVRVTAKDARSAQAQDFKELTQAHTVILVCDPGAETVAQLLETSLWEAAICPVQQTDLRNLAHGRHTWLHHRPGKTWLLGLVGVQSRPLWSRIQTLAPRAVATATLDLGDNGRFRNAVGVVEALGLVDAMGAAVGIDPGKPGIGDFGRELYADSSLLDLAKALQPCIRQKRDAMAERDDPAQSDFDLVASAAARTTRISEASIGAVIMDYDGTIVTTEERFSPPSQEVLNELVRLHAAGVVIAIATGRGGSAGEALRNALPEAMHSNVMMGYYNGGYVVPLSVDIADAPPAPDPAIDRISARVAIHPQVTTECRWRNSGVQLTIPTAPLSDANAFVDAISTAPEVSDGILRVTRSAHSVDVVPALASKLALVSAVLALVEPGSEALTFGDSGARGGNDSELLSRSHGISVGMVCGRSEGTYSLLGRRNAGPQALVDIMKCILPDADGRMRLDLHRLPVDNDAK